VQHGGMFFVSNGTGADSVFSLHRLRGVAEDDPRINQPEYVQAVTGACIAMTRDLYFQVGGMSEDYGMYYEDVDLCLKVSKAGKRIFYEPRAVIIHHEGKSSDTHEDAKRLDERARAVFLGKWGTELPALAQRVVSAPPKNILWIRADSIGDAVLASSMLPCILSHYLGARITVVCQAHIAELYESSPFVDAVIGFDRLKGYQDEAYRNLIVQELRELHADLALNSLYSRDPLYDLFAINSGARTSIAFNGNLCNIAADVRDKNNVHYTKIITDNGEHKAELERHRDFLEGIGISVSKLEPTIWLKPEDEEFAEKFFKDNNLGAESTVCLFAGAQNNVRIYQKYGFAVQEICKSYGLSVIGLGGSDDSKINIQNLDATGARTINLSGKTTLRQTAAILKRCRLAVGAETGLAHMACAVGTANVILLGGGHFGRFMPYSPLTSIVCLPLECYSCNWKCRYDRVHCIKDIIPEVIAEAVRQTLEKKSDKPRLFVQGTSLWEAGLQRPKWKLFNEHLDINTVEIILVGVGPLIPKTANDQYKTSQECITSGNFNEAINELEKLLEVYPNFAIAYNDLGVIYYYKGDKERALKYYEQAVALNPENNNFQKNLADFYFVELSRTEDAIKIYLKVLATNPEDIEALLAIGKFCVAVEKIDQAKVFFNRVLAIEPQNSIAIQSLNTVVNSGLVRTSSRLDRQASAYQLLYEEER
jgi:ADP-heptose:LPS heptosyltransferase